MSDVYVPPVPTSKMSENDQRDFILKEFLQKLKDKLDSLDSRITALGG